MRSGALSRIVGMTKAGVAPRPALGPAGGDGLDLGVEPHALHAVLVGVAEGERFQPPKVW